MNFNAYPQDAFGAQVYPSNGPFGNQPPAYATQSYSQRPPSVGSPASPAQSVGSFSQDHAGTQWSPQLRQSSAPLSVQPVNGQTMMNGRGLPPIDSPQFANWLRTLAPDHRDSVLRGIQQQQVQAAALQRPVTVNPVSQMGSNPSFPAPLPPSQQQARIPQVRHSETQAFMQRLLEHLNSTGRSLQGLPQIEGFQIDLARLFQLVQHSGGFVVVQQSRQWDMIASNLGFPSENGHPPSRLASLQDIYQNFLFSFEVALKSQQSQPKDISSSVSQQERQTPPKPVVPPLAAQLAAQNQLNLSQPVGSPKLKLSASSSRQHHSHGELDQNADNGVPPPSQSQSSQIADNKFPESPKVSKTIVDDEGTPVASTSKAKLKGQTSPKSTTSSNKRKRQKIEYIPFSRPMESFGGYDDTSAGRVQGLVRKRPARTVVDVAGGIDMFPLVMSLRSGIPSEQVYALNTLNLVAQATRTEAFDSRFVFDVRQHQDVLDALIDLLDETAFPPDGLGVTAQKRPRAPKLYREHATLAAERKMKFRCYNQSKKEFILLPSQLILNIVNTLRTLALSVLGDQNTVGNFLGNNAMLVDLLCRLCDFGPDDTDKMGKPWRSPVNLTFEDLLTLRKDVLAILAELDVMTNLVSFQNETTDTIMDLICFFLLDPTEFPDALHETEGAKKIGLRHGETSGQTASAIALLTRIGALDSNREKLARAKGADQLYSLFESLLCFLPLEQADLSAILQFDPSHLDRIAFALYNLVFMSSPDARRKILNWTPVVNLILRLLSRCVAHTRLITSSGLNVFMIRLLEVLALLTASEEAKNSGDSIDPNAPFFGGAFANPFDIEEKSEDVKGPRLSAGSSVDCIQPVLLRFGQFFGPEVYFLLSKLFG